VNLWRSAILSYRAMFLWLNPVGYLSSRLIYPVSLAILFASLPATALNHARASVGMPLLAVVTAGSEWVARPGLGSCSQLTVSGASTYPFPMIIGKGSIPAGSIAFRLDPASGVPTYLQLVQQVEQALRLGVLGPGDQLPTVKEVVEGLAINPNTVQKAYRELEHRGLAAGKPGQGTFVKAALRRVGGPAQEALARRLGEWMRDAVASGLDQESIGAMFAAALRDLGERRDGVSA
jgi:GntR family transcriptional regulator